MRLMRRLCLLCLGAVVSMPIGCGGDDGTGSPVDLPEDPTIVRVAAAPPADAFVREAAAAFENETDVRVRVDVVSARRAAAAFCNGDARVAALPRQPSGPQQRNCDRLRSDSRHTVAHQAAVILANADMALRCLDTNDLRRLWMRASPVKELSDLKDGLPGGHLELFGPPRGRSTIDLFRQRVLKGRDLRAYRSVEDSPVLTELVDANPRAIAFYGYSRIDESVPTPLNLISVRSDASCVPPTPATVRSGRYPLARDVYLLGPDAKSASAAGRFTAWAVANRRRAGLTTERVTAAARRGDSR